jgi:ParB family chromosome partitioning protein
VSKRGLPTGVQMRHDFHYVEELTRSNRPVGKIIPIDRIEPNPDQPRHEFGDLTELTESIREKGVLEPLLVKPIGNGRYMIIAGERRWRASNLAGLEELPCIELDIDNEGVAEIALIENLQRKDLTVWEEADGLKALADKFGYTQDQIAKKISKSRTTVTELMTVAGLTGEVRERCKKLAIASKAGLLEVARQFDEAAMLEHLNKIENGEIKPVQIRREVKSKVDSTNGSVTHSKTSNTFSYASKEGAIKINISFNDNEGYDKRRVLEALKQAFDDIKEGIYPV